MNVGRLARQLPRYAWWSLIGGLVVLLGAATAGAAGTSLIGLVVLIPFAWSIYRAVQQPGGFEPFPWPTDLRAAAQGMARPIDPEPKRILPKDQNAPEIAEVSVTQEGVDKLLADRPPLWRWAVFTSVLVQRRNAVQRRLRDCALGYQPRGGMRHDGRSYSALAYQVMQEVADLVAQLEQFMLSPGFTGALKSFSEDDGAEPDAILHIANRLMDYHEGFLSQAERCLHATVNRDVIVFVQDMAAFTMCPLAGYEQFIETMCRRVAEGQELLPYAEGTVLLDDVQLAISLPDGLAERITAHIRQFSL